MSTRNLLLPIILLTLACSATTPLSTTNNADSLADSEWRIKEIRGESLAAEPTPTMRFAEGGELSGNAGCNLYRATWSGEGSSLTIELIGASKRLCPEPAALMDQEKRFLDALTETATFEAADGTPRLLAQDGRVLLTLVGAETGE